MNILTMGIELSAVVHRWRAQLEGSFALLDENNHDVSPRGRKARAIIVYLIAHQDVRIPRERLMALLWGDRGEIQARTSLRQALTEIRRASGELISSDRDHAWIDSEVLVDPPTSSSGEFAEDLSHITPEFDDWLMSERHRRTSEDWNKLHGEVEALLATGRGAEAMPLIDRMQLIDPYNEDWLRSAMRAEAQAGHPAAIKKVYREMAARLQLELGVAPAKATRALHDELLSELIGPTSPDLRADAVLDDQREVQASEDRVDTSERKLGSAMPRRLVVGGALVGVTAAIVGTPLWLGSGESSLSPTAMEYYRRGIELRGQASLSQAEQSVAYLREATRIDPEFGEAWGALAWGYRSLLEYGPRPNAGQTAMLARKAASRALEIHPGDTQALAALLLLKPIYGNWAEIEAGCRRLLKGDAAHSLVQFNLALTLCEVGRWRDALPILSDLARREPFWPLVQVRTFCALMSAGRLEEAEDLLDAAIKKWPRRPDFWSMKSRYLLETGRLQEAVAFVSDVAKRPASADRWIDVEIILTKAFASNASPVRNASATQLADFASAEPLYIPLVAGALIMLGKVPSVFDMLEGYYFGRGPWSAAHQARPTTSVLFLAPTAELRQYSRFGALLRETGLEDYWAETQTKPDYRQF